MSSTSFKNFPVLELLSSLVTLKLRCLGPDEDPFPTFEIKLHDDTRCYATRRLGGFADEERGHKDRQKIKNERRLYNAACASSNSASDTQYHSTFMITRKKETKSSETTITPGKTNGTEGGGRLT